MKTIVYKCNKCKKVLSDPSQGIEIPHLSIKFAKPSGYVKRFPGGRVNCSLHHVYTKSDWGFELYIKDGIHQFCNPKCMMEWVADQKNVAIRGEIMSITHTTEEKSSLTIPFGIFIKIWLMVTGWMIIWRLLQWF